MRGNNTTGAVLWIVFSLNWFILIFRIRIFHIQYILHLFFHIATLQQPHTRRWLSITSLFACFTSVNRPHDIEWHVAPWPRHLMITGAVSEPIQEIEALQRENSVIKPWENWLTHTIIISWEGYTFQAGWNFSLCWVVLWLHLWSSLQ